MSIVVPRFKRGTAKQQNFKRSQIDAPADLQSAGKLSPTDCKFQ